MATIDSKEAIAELIELDGWYPGDHLRVTKIVQYTNFNGRTAWGIVYSSEDQLRYERESPYVQDPVVLWAANGTPCDMRSSVTDVPCELAAGHPMWDATRFHKFSPPKA